MDIKGVLYETITQLKEEFMQMFQENGQKREQLGAFGDIFYKEFDSYLHNAGKRIRPFLVITAFNAVGGNHAEGNINRASLAIELLHNGSLLHDDVIDKDETRRGEPSFHVIFRELYKKQREEDHLRAQEFGNAISIFAGDLCFPFAIDSLIQSGFPEELRIRALHAFAEGFREVIDGVILETSMMLNHENDEELYNKMVYLKTGALIRKSVEIGAILGRGTETQIQALVDYCTGLGKAFQIQDDILGVFGDPEELGKPVGGDIREGKQTILLISALQKCTAKQKQRLQALVGNENINDKELEEVQKIIKETKALQYATKEITKATAEAITALDKAKPPLKETQKNQLIALAKYLENRNK
jgi:geranylgeranyl diphosphate synthase type I